MSNELLYKTMANDEATYKRIMDHYYTCRMCCDHALNEYKRHKESYNSLVKEYDRLKGKRNLLNFIFLDIEIRKVKELINCSIIPLAKVAAKYKIVRNEYMIYHDIVKNYKNYLDKNIMTL